MTLYPLYRCNPRFPTTLFIHVVAKIAVAATTFASPPMMLMDLLARSADVGPDFGCGLKMENAFPPSFRSFSSSQMLTTALFVVLTLNRKKITKRFW